MTSDCDWICPSATTIEYAWSVTAPAKEAIVIEGCGHSPQYTLPEEFAKELLSSDILI